MFEGDTYTVRQKLISIGTRYAVYEDGVHVLSSKKRKFRLAEDFRFTDPGGVPVLRVTTDQVLDVNATYTVVDERTDEVVGALQRDWQSYFKHHWRLYDADGEHVATVQEDGVFRAFLRRKVTGLLPFSYDVVGADGAHLGDIDGRFSLRDEYVIDLTDDVDHRVDRRLAVAAGVVVDAIEGN